MEVQPKSKTGGRETLPKQGWKLAHWTGSPLGFSGSRVRGVLGYGSSWFSGSSPKIPSSCWKSAQNRRKTDSRRSGFTGRESLGHGLHGFRTHRGHGLTGDQVAGVLWSHRHHPAEGRAPSPLTLLSLISFNLSSLCSGRTEKKET